MVWRPKAWDNLAACVEDLIAPPLKGRLTIGHHKMARDGDWCGRYWFDLDGQRIWELPGPWASLHYSAHYWNSPSITRWEDASITERLIGTYLDTPRDELLEPIERDKYGLTDILRAADRRIGFLRLSFWAMATLDTRPARTVLGARFADRRKRF
jgi:hypothetical protein